MATSRLRDLETGSRKSSDSSESGRITSGSVGAADFSPPVLSTTEDIDVGVVRSSEKIDQKRVVGEGKIDLSGVFLVAQLFLLLQQWRTISLTFVVW